MSRALIYLLVTLNRNRLRRFLRDLRRPSRAAGMLMWGGLVMLLVWSTWQAEAPGEMQGGVLLSFYLAFVLLISVISGFMQRGVAFQPADIDLLFPAPFRRHELILYRLCTLYSMCLFSGLIFLLLVGRYVTRPLYAYLGIVLCQVFATHLQTAIAILSTLISDRLFQRMRRPLQIVAILFGLIPLAVVLMMVLANVGGWSGLLREALSSDVARILFYPALAAGELSAVGSFGAAAPHLLGLLACIAVSFVVIVVLPINFFEASLATSALVAQALARARRGVAATLPDHHARKIQLPRWALFRGAGAILWKNLHVAGRSLRVLVVAMVFATGLAVPVILGDQIRSGPAPDPGEAMVPGLALGVIAFLPVFLQLYLAFDFRRDASNMAELKSLPLHPIAVAAAEVATPVLLATAIQVLLLTAYAITGGTPLWVFLLALVTYPAISLGTMLIGNLAFLIMPTPATTEAGRPSLSGAAGGMLITWLGLAVALAPAALIGFLVWQRSQSTWLAFTLALLVQYLVDLLLLGLLGKTFERFDLSRDLI